MARMSRTHHVLYQGHKAVAYPGEGIDNWTVVMETGDIHEGVSWLSVTYVYEEETDEYHKLWDKE